MGHTLVAAFDQAGYAQIQRLLDKAGIHDNNKIPLGRDCDRDKAYRILPYHMTLFHWEKKCDEKYLRALDNSQFIPSRLFFTGTTCLPGKEYSLALCMVVKADEGFAEMTNVLENVLSH